MLQLAKKQKPEKDETIGKTVSICLFIRMVAQGMKEYVPDRIFPQALFPPLHLLCDQKFVHFLSKSVVTCV